MRLLLRGSWAVLMQMTTSCSFYTRCMMSMRLLDLLGWAVFEKDSADTASLTTEVHRNYFSSRLVKLCSRTKLVVTTHAAIVLCNRFFKFFHEYH